MDSFAIDLFVRSVYIIQLHQLFLKLKNKIEEVCIINKKLESCIISLNYSYMSYLILIERISNQLNIDLEKLIGNQVISLIGFTKGETFLREGELCSY